MLVSLKLSHCSHCSLDADMCISNFFGSAVVTKCPSVCNWFKIIKQTERENRTRQEAVAFGQNQNTICDIEPCQGCVVWIVIAGNIVIGKGLRSAKQKHPCWRASFCFFLQTQVLLITFSFGGVYGIYCFLPVCTGAQVTALVFVKIVKRSPLENHMFVGEP